LIRRLPLRAERRTSSTARATISLMRARRRTGSGRGPGPGLRARRGRLGVSGSGLVGKGHEARWWGDRGVRPWPDHRSAGRSRRRRRGIVHGRRSAFEAGLEMGPVSRTAQSRPAAVVKRIAVGVGAGQPGQSSAPGDSPPLFRRFVDQPGLTRTGGLPLRASLVPSNLPFGLCRLVQGRGDDCRSERAVRALPRGARASDRQSSRENGSTRLTQVPTAAV
jgi:hypothetical protein